MATTGSPSHGAPDSLRAIFQDEISKELRTWLVEHAGPERDFGQNPQTVHGDNYRVPIVTKLVFQSGFREVGGDLPRDTPQLGSASDTRRPDAGFMYGSVAPAREYARMRFDGDDLDVNTNTTDKVIDLIELRTRLMKTSMAREHNRIWHGDGSGMLAEVAATASTNDTTIQLKLSDQAGNRFYGHDGARWMWNGRNFVCSRTGTTKLGTFGYR